MHDDFTSTVDAAAAVARLDVEPPEPPTRDEYEDCATAPRRVVDVVTAADFVAHGARRAARPQRDPQCAEDTLDELLGF